VDFFGPALKDTKIRTSAARAGADVIVHSIGRGYSREAEIVEITDEEFRIGDIRVGTVKQVTLFPKERIIGPDINQNHAEGWDLNGAKISSNGVDVTVSSPITQIVNLKYTGLSSLEPDLARLIKLILVTK